MKSRRVFYALCATCLLPLLGMAAGAANAGAGLRIADEVAPAGGVALIRVELTEPRPISGGTIRLSLSSFAPSSGSEAAPAPLLGPPSAVALLSGNGDVQGSGNGDVNGVTVSFVSPRSTFGTDLDLPIVVLAFPVNADAPAGAGTVLSIDLANTTLRDSSGQPYAMEVKPGTFTVGGVSITKLISPSLTPAAGSTLVVQGVGFQPGANLDIGETAVLTSRFIDSRQIEFTIGNSFPLDSTRIRLKNPDATNDVFYAIPQLRSIGQGSGPPAVSFGFRSLSLVRGASAQVPVDLASGGFGGTINVSCSSPCTLDHPSSLPFGPNDSRATLRVFAANAGDSTLTATLGTTSASIPVHVSDGTVLHIPVIRNDSLSQMGLALTNAGPAAADVQLRGFADPQAVINTSVSIPPGGQTSRFLSQYDPRFENFRGWVEVSSENPDVHAMFLNKPSNFSAFAGSSDGTDPSSEFILAQSGEDPAGDFEFAFINNNFLESTVTFEWSDGAGVTPSITRILGPQEVIIDTAKKMFPERPIGVGSGYLRIRSPQPLVGYQQIQSAALLFGQAPTPVSRSSKRLLLPQFVAGAGWFTNLTLINPGSFDLEVTVTLLDDLGAPVTDSVQGNPVKLNVPARSQVALQGKDSFGIPEASFVVGSLIIDAPAAILGSSVIGDAVAKRYVTAVPVEGRMFSEAIFAQVANGSNSGIGYFTGLAFQNPNPDQAVIQIEVLSEKGQITGQSSVSLTARGRMSKLLSELVPGLPAQIGGHIRVVSSLPIVMLETFGNDRLDFLTTVAPSIVR